jgi:hypothetical protein
MFLEPYLLSGPLRIIFLFALTLIVHRLISVRVSALTALNFLIPTITLVLAAVVIGGFVLVLTSTFDLFVLISIGIMLILLTFMRLDFTKPLDKQLKKIYTRTILYGTIKLEKREKFLDKDNIIKPKYENREKGLSRFHKNWQLAVGLLLPVITYISRNSLFQQDIFTLSPGWFKKLKLINGISVDQWFFQPGEMMGDLLLINLYSKLTNITHAQALQTFGILESALLSVIIYWVSFKILRKHSSGIFAGLSFALLYAFLPINIALLAEHKSVFTALIIALPTLFFCIYPQSFRFTRKLRFVWMFILFSAILLIDLFVGIILVFPFLLILSLFKYQNPQQNFQLFLGYFASVLFLGTFYGIASFIKGENFWTFIISNLYSFEAYTYNPYLIIPFGELMNYYQLAGIVCLVITFLFYIMKPQKWLASIVFLLFINILFAVYQLNAVLVDPDILNQVFCIFIPIFFGIILNLVVSLVPFLNVAPRRAVFLEVGVGALLITALVITSFPDQTIPATQGDKTNNLVFKAYSKIQSTHLPYTYAVVNSRPYSGLSKNSHYYYDYPYFNNGYISRDRQYHRYKDQPEYLSNNPNLILPQTLFVFIYKNNKERNLAGQEMIEDQHNVTLQRIELLKAKGRDIRMYYQSEDLMVYQIVNNTGASNVNDLLFQ